MSEAPKDISIPVWVKGGVGMVRRSCLDPDHPESEYNYIKDKLGLVPEEYGVYGKYDIVAKEMEEKSRRELIHMIVDLRRELDAYIAAGF